MDFSQDVHLGAALACEWMGWLTPVEFCLHTSAG